VVPMVGLHRLPQEVAVTVVPARFTTAATRAMAVRSGMVASATAARLQTTVADPTDVRLQAMTAARLAVPCLPMVAAAVRWVPTVAAAGRHPMGEVAVVARAALVEVVVVTALCRVEAVVTAAAVAAMGDADAADSKFDCRQKQRRPVFGRRSLFGVAFGDLSARTGGFPVLA